MTCLLVGSYVLLVVSVIRLTDFNLCHLSACEGLQFQIFRHERMCSRGGNLSLAITSNLESSHERMGMTT